MTRAHGVRGAVLVRIDASVREVLRAGLDVELTVGGSTSRHELVAVADHGRGVRLTLSGVDDREAADKLRNATLSVRREVLPALGEGEYYDFEIVGSRVVTPTGEELGTVIEIVATGANDVYVVEGPKGEILVPAIERAVLSIEAEESRIVVEPTALQYSGETETADE